MKNKKSNVKKEMLNVLQLLNEGLLDNAKEALENAKNKATETAGNIQNKVNEVGKNIEQGLDNAVKNISQSLDVEDPIPVYVTDDIYKDVLEITKDTATHVSPHTLVYLKISKTEYLKQQHNNLKMIFVPFDVAQKLPGSPAWVYTTLSPDEFALEITSKLRKYLNITKDFAKAHQGSLIGAGVGAGVTAAGWAAARAYLQKQLNDCKDEKCRKDIKAKISKLNKLALLGGIGLTAIGAVAQPLSTAIAHGVKGITGKETNNDNNDQLKNK
jgi:formiminotetrahydrofolate cyclodeaminase